MILTWATYLGAHVLQHQRINRDNWTVKMIVRNVYGDATKCMLINEYVISLFAARGIGQVPQVHQCAHVLKDIKRRRAFKVKKAKWP